MIRISLTLAALTLQLTQAVAQDWTPFGIKKFGFIVDVPPGFVYVRSLRENAPGGRGISERRRRRHRSLGIALDIRDFRDNVEALMGQQRKTKAGISPTSASPPNGRPILASKTALSGTSKPSPSAMTASPSSSSTTTGSQAGL